MTMPIDGKAPKPRRYVMKDQAGKIIAHAELRQVPVDVIQIDPRYQRDVKQSWMQLNLPYDATKAGAIILSSRAGGPYCIDGGHRVALAKASGISHVNALVITHIRDEQDRREHPITKMDEARLFVSYQRTRTNLTAYALFRAEIEAGDETTLAMVTVVNRAGFLLSDKTGPRTITAIDSVRYIHRYGGDDLLEETLDLVQEAWFEFESALTGQTLKGLALFLASAQEHTQFDRQRLIKLMGLRSPTRLSLEGQEIASNEGRAPNASPSNIAAALQKDYNEGVKRLPKAKDPLPPLRINNKSRPTTSRPKLYGKKP